MPSNVKIAAARVVAYDILRKVEAGGYASDLLLTRSAGLDPRDAGLAAEIVFGVLRYRAQLDYLIDYYSGRARKLDLEVRIALRMGIYQLRYLERVPAHAAVKESVELVKRARKISAAGFVNAVLRQVNRDPIAWPSREIELSCPEWLLARWEAAYGADAAGAIARAALEEPEKYVRISPAGDRMQDIGSQSIVPLLDLAPGQRFLDLCAAPGNKTAQALEAGVRAVACDIHFHRLVQLKPLTPNLVVLDGTAAAAIRGAFRPHPGGRPLLRHGNAGPQSRDQVAAQPGGPGRSARPASRPAGQCARGPRPRGNPGLFHLLARARRERRRHRGRARTEIAQSMRRLPGRDAGDGFYACVIKSE